jgi:hypothetical protein
VRNVRRVSRVGDQSGERSSHSAASLGKGEQRDAAVRGAAVTFSRETAGKEKARGLSSVMAGVAE